MTKRILITGSTGFVGQQLVRDLIKKEVELYLPVRNTKVDFGFAENKKIHLIEHDSIETYQGEGLPEKIDALVHLVAKAHVTEDESLRDEYYAVNVKGTQALAEVAQEKQAKHFIYLSSIKVNGDATFGSGFSENDVVQPAGVYAETKYQAEQQLNQLVSKGIKVSIIRTPLVYGKGVKANMAALVKMVGLLPVLPFGAFDNRRSLISVRNLSDFIQTLLFNEPLVQYETSLFLISDREPVSTAQMCTVIAEALNRNILMLNIPKWCLKALLVLIGKKSMWNKLAGSLEVRGINAEKYFKWSAPNAMVDELRYLAEENK